MQEFQSAMSRFSCSQIPVSRGKRPHGEEESTGDDDDGGDMARAADPDGRSLGARRCSEHVEHKDSFHLYF